MTPAGWTTDNVTETEECHDSNRYGMVALRGLREAQGTPGSPRGARGSLALWGITVLALPMYESDNPGGLRRIGDGFFRKCSESLPQASGASGASGGLWVWLLALVTRGSGQAEGCKKEGSAIWLGQGTPAPWTVARARGGPGTAQGPPGGPTALRDLREAHFTLVPQQRG